MSTWWDSASIISFKTFTNSKIGLRSKNKIVLARRYLIHSPKIYGHRNTITLWTNMKSRDNSIVLTTTCIFLINLGSIVPSASASSSKERPKAKIKRHCMIHTRGSITYNKYACRSVLLLNHIKQAWQANRPRSNKPNRLKRSNPSLNQNPKQCLLRGWIRSMISFLNWIN